jgi:hypothetical protein
MAFGKKNQDEDDEQERYTEPYVTRSFTSVGGGKNIAKICNDMQAHGYTLVAQSSAHGTNLFRHWLTFKKEQ